MLSTFYSGVNNSYTDVVREPVLYRHVNFSAMQEAVNRTEPTTESRSASNTVLVSLYADTALKRAYNASVTITEATQSSSDDSSLLELYDPSVTSYSANIPSH